MSAETRDLITWSITTTIGICTLLGLLVRFVLMPYVRQHIVQPVKETREQVQNDHDTNLRGDVDVIRDEQREMRQAIERLATAVDTQGAANVEHSRWSQEWVARVELQLADLDKRIAAVEP